MGGAGLLKTWTARLPRLPNLPSMGGWLPKLGLDLASGRFRKLMPPQGYSHPFLPQQSALAISELRGTIGWEAVKSSLLRKTLVLNILLVREQLG
jgi:hypothetical protein